MGLFINRRIAVESLAEAHPHAGPPIKDSQALLDYWDLLKGKKAR